MRRRQFITSASATIAAASLAGCSGILGGDGGSSGPDGAVEAYVSALDGNDPQAVEDAIHPEGTLSADMSQEELEAIEASVQSTEVTEGPENGEATVEAEVEVTVSIMGQEQTETQTTTFDVREHEGEWKVYGEA